VLGHAAIERRGTSFGHRARVSKVRQTAQTWLSQRKTTRDTVATHRMYSDTAHVSCRRRVCHFLRPDVRYTKGFCRAVTTPASNSAVASRRLHTFAAKQSAAGPLLIAAAVKHSQADLLTADPTSVGAENICSEQITLGQPLICMSTTLAAEVCMQFFCC